MSIKNSIEIEGSKKAHLADGIALSNFWFWLNEIDDKEITEKDICLKILELKKEAGEKIGLKFFEESFETIAGFEENSAIIHYNPSQTNSKKISKNGLLLLDQSIEVEGNCF